MKVEFITDSPTTPVIRISEDTTAPRFIEFTVGEILFLQAQLSSMVEKFEDWKGTVRVVNERTGD